MTTAELPRKRRSRSVLVAYDGSPEACRALRRAAALTDGGRLTIINVIPVRESARDSRRSAKPVAKIRCASWTEHNDCSGRVEYAQLCRLGHGIP
jgi:nucleotide-binding universal stress UspA family protein